MKPTYSERVKVGMPPPLVAAVADAAATNMTSVSSYIRSALLLKLRTDGIELPPEKA
jgi:hypothetical protein